MIVGMMRMIPEPRPRYPSDNSQVGGVMLFFRVDAQGQIASHQIVARAGSDAFAQSIERVVDGWRVERIEEGSAPNCRMESNIMLGVRFVLPG